MIRGFVNSENQAVIHLVIYGKNDEELETKAIVDTGFNAWLTLPHQSIATLKLNFHSRGRAELADGSECVFNVFVGNVEWFGTMRRIFVYEADAEPLAGMALLGGCQLKINVEREGAVTIQRLVELTT
jgi:clan AA aspartic protease